MDCVKSNKYVKGTLVSEKQERGQTPGYESRESNVLSYGIVVLLFICLNAQDEPTPHICRGW